MQNTVNCIHTATYTPCDSGSLLMVMDTSGSTPVNFTGCARGWGFVSSVNLISIAKHGNNVPG